MSDKSDIESDQGKKSQSLSRRTLKAGSWTLVATLAQYVLRLASNLIMTRFLLPEAFGMIALAATILTALNLFTDVGIKRSIIREADGEEPHFLRVAWVVKIIRSGVIALGVVTMALMVWIFGAKFAPESSVYAQPEMPGLIVLVALSPLLLGFASTSLELATRRLEYGRIAVVETLGLLSGILAMIAFVQFSATVWTLMCGMLVNHIVQCLLTHFYLPGPRMKLCWDKAIADRLWKFGKWLLASSAVTFLGRNADKLILGAFLNSVNFGIFTIAQIWMDAGQILISRFGDGVGFAAIAEVIRTRPKEVRRLYRRYQHFMDIACFMGFVMAFWAGPYFIGLLYTDTYQLAGYYMQLMSPAFLVLRFQSLFFLVMNMGNSRGIFISSVIRAISMCIAVVIGFRLFGIEGAIIATVLAPMVGYAYILVLTKEILGPRQTLYDILWFVGAILIAIIVAILV